MNQEQAYEKFYRPAREYALILQAASGVTTVVYPATQRSEGLPEKIQHLHGLGAHPDALASKREAAFKVRQLPLLGEV